MIRLVFISCIWTLIALTNKLAGQCDPPSLLQVTERTTTTITVKWNYFQDAQGWELAIFKDNENPDLQPQTPVIQEKTYSFSQLDPATAYKIFIRTVCEDTSTSEWTPITSLTQIPNPSPCFMNLPIKNNNCSQSYEHFPIVVNDENGLLGVDLFLESVDIMIEHTWPSDLDIRLVSPSGQEISLARHRGTGSDNYGNIEDNDCLEVTSFSDLACKDISGERPPFIGSFRPEDNLKQIEDGTSPNGIWLLKTCDRSIPDIGFLHYINLNFEPLLCPLPQDIVITEVDGQSIDISWENFDNCNFLELRIKPVGAPADETVTFSLNCENESFTIPDLSQGTEYEILLLSDCFDSNSPVSCPLYVTTLCSSATVLSGFDELSLCEAGCSARCDDLGGIWHNHALNTQDWLIHSGMTPTTGTGPEDGVNNSGNYLYVESAPDLCGPDNIVVIESTCMAVEASENCNMNFWYHMNGSDVGSLLLTIKEEYADQWDTLFLKHGPQGEDWLEAKIDLSKYDGKAAKLRFTAILTDGEAGDIALDEIAFLGSYSLNEGLTYFQDFDFDGYGNEKFSRIECALNAPSGWVQNADDCDDEMPSVNPEAEEILCNGIDENCNGLSDDQDASNPLTYDSIIQFNSCVGIADGAIELEISGGMPPYSVDWDSGKEGTIIDSLGKGVYHATIMDAAGCIIHTGPLSILSEKSLNIFVKEIKRPSCDGIDDGQVVVQASGGTGGYNYSWSNGMTGDSISGLSPDTLRVTVSDVDNCTTTSQEIIVKAIPQVEVGTLLKKNVSCYNASDGRVTLQSAGGQEPYNYTWSNGESGPSLDNLKAGSYTALVQDQNGCQKSITVAITEPPPLDIYVANKENNPCWGNHLGEIHTTTTGGVPPYTYLWNNGAINDDLYNLPAGAYSVVVTDANACKDTIKAVPVLHPPLLSGSTTLIEPAECRNSKDGKIQINVSGGKPDYNYFWSNDINGQSTIDSINPGLYNVTIIDANDCKLRIDNITVPNLEKKLNITLTGNDLNQCGRDSLSSLYVTLQEAAFPVDFNWSSGIQRQKSILSDTITGLPGGRYSVTATDARGCVGKSDPIDFKIITPITASANIQNNLCYGEREGSINLNPTGGTPPYAVAWNTGSDDFFIDELQNGSYVATIMDDEECTYTTQPFKVISPDSLSINTTILPSGTEDNAGSIELIIQGGKAPYMVHWPVEVDAHGRIAHNLPSGDYIIQVEDSNGCMGTISVNVPMFSSTVDLSTGISIYPNPSHGFYSIINNTGLEITSIDVISMTGELFEVVQHGFIPETLPSGNYIIRVVLEDGYPIYRNLVLIRN